MSNDVTVKLAEALRLSYPIVEGEKSKQDASYGSNFSPTKAERAWAACTKAREALAAYEMSQQAAPKQAQESQLRCSEPVEATANALYWRLHSLSTSLEARDVIDGMENKDAYPTILDAMAFVQAARAAMVAKPAQAQQARDPVTVYTNRATEAEPFNPSAVQTVQLGGSPAQAQQAEAWCVSYDEERFWGDLPTREAAIAELEGRGGWIAKVANPKDLVSAYHIGESAFEAVSEALGDTVGEVVESFKMTKDERTALGRVVLEWIDSGPGFRCFGVREVEGIGASTGGKP